MSPEEFEVLAALGAREVEGLRLEFLGGRVSVKHGRDLDMLPEEFTDLESAVERALPGVRVQFVDGRLRFTGRPG